MEMNKWMICYEYQMPGDDEFGKVSWGEWICEAESKEDAMAKWEHHRTTCPRGPARFGITESVFEMTQAHLDRYYSKD